MPFCSGGGELEMCQSVDQRPCRAKKALIGSPIDFRGDQILEKNLLIQDSGGSAETDDSTHQPNENEARK